jgi:LuxR family transcriptional regulator, maltose regulon positive regulatory protein
VSQNGNNTGKTEVPVQARQNSETAFHFERSRLNDLFMEAVKYPLVVVCAGAGYGKTSAVHDFLEKYEATTAWVQLTELDNERAHFWETAVHAIGQINQDLAKATNEYGFPDTKEKLKHYNAIIQKHIDLKRRIIVFDDFHCIDDPLIIRFMEECVLFKMPPGTSVFLVSRSTPRANLTGMIYRDQIFNISENDLRFTESELAQYFHSRNTYIQPESLREIMQDTGGWAFAINLIVRSYQKAPGYGGYLQNAMKTNIFQLIETEIWGEISERLQTFLIRLSLIDHLSVDFISLLAEGDKTLIAELERQNAYVRRDSYVNAYLIHPLFLEFLRSKQESLSEEHRRETYSIAGNWCKKNGFRIDALSYYEKTKNYQGIVSILDELTAQIPQVIAQFAAPILDRAPEDAFDNVEFLAEMHLRTYLCQGLWQKSIELVKFYEAKFLKLPEKDIVRNRTLAQLNVCWSYIRALMSTTDDIFDFEIYMGKANKYASTLEDPGKFDSYYSGAWVNFAGSSRKGVLEEFINVVTRIRNSLSHDFLKGSIAGEIELLRGELDFYRGNLNSAPPLLNLAVKEARFEKQFGFVHRSLFYTLRIAVSQGNFALAEQAIKDTKAQLDETSYIYRFMDYDISLSWYYCFLGMPEKMAEWLKEDFSSYIHAAFIENFGNQIKARFFYTTRDYVPLLAYIGEMKTRESILYGRVEMLAIEACIHYKMKNNKKAFSVFLEAYENALPNGILMPFIELGKDMRTLTAVALKQPGNKIPRPWLEDVNRKSATYAKRRTHVIAEYKKAYGITDGVVFSPREAEILTDLSHGFSRVEIANSRGLSVNTVKMVINMLYAKVGAENLADLIRIAVEQKLI